MLDNRAKYNKKNTNKQNKIKVNIYLIYPNDVHYHMMIYPYEIIGNLLKYIEFYFPKSKYDYTYMYKNDNPIFIDMETGNVIDISKSYIDNGLLYKDNSSVISNSSECSIKINLKITQLKETVELELK